MKFLAVVLSSCVLVACGGGGSSSTPGAQDTPADLTVSGTAATGKAIAGAPISAKCQVGIGTATTIADGTYSLVVAGGKLPCLLQITDPADGSKLHTVATGSGSAASANITPLTEMLTARVLGNEPSVFFAAFDASVATSKVTTTTVKAAQTDVGTVLTGTVDTSPLGDFISTPLKAATQGNLTGGDAQDKLLDALRIKINAAQLTQVVTALAKTKNTDDIKQVVANIAAVPPVAQAGVAQSVVTGTVVVLDGGTSSVGLSRTLTYAWTLTTKPAGSIASLSAPTSVKPTFTADVTGTYVATLIVSDGNINSSAAAVSIVASAVNAAPVANAGVAQNVVSGTVVTLDGSSSSDANNDQITYAWTLTAKPATSTASLAAPTSGKPAFTADRAGTYVVTLIVNDGKVNSNAATVSITAAIANVAPVANAGVPQKVVAGTVVILDGSASSDANSDSLTYAWSLTSKPSGSSATLGSVTSAKPTFTADVAGIYVASLIVNDGKVNSTAMTATVSVINPFISTDFASSEDTGSSITLQTDGKILVAGTTEIRGYRDFAMARYNLDGSLDSTFGIGGKVTSDIAAVDIAKNITLQVDGKILVVGSSSSSYDIASVFVVVRYNTDGSLDSSFGGSGKVTTHIGSSFNESPIGVVQLSDGKILVGGSSPDGFLLARYQSNGSLDLTFGSNGKVIKRLSQFVDATDMTVLTDGAIALVGSNRYDNDFFVARFNANGSSDSTFGSAGVVYTRFDMDVDGNTYLGFGRTDTAGAVAVDTAGRLVVAGSSEFNMGQGYIGRVAVARYLSNGTLDTSFSNRGFVLTGFPTSLGLHVNINDMAIQVNGKILLIGNTVQQSGSYRYNVILARYNSDGSLDNSFGVGGLVIPSAMSSTNSNFGSGVQILTNGKILVSGSRFNGVNMDFSLVRYNSDGSLDATFGSR